MVGTCRTTFPSEPCIVDSDPCNEDHHSRNTNRDNVPYDGFAYTRGRIMSVHENQKRERKWTPCPTELTRRRRCWDGSNVSSACGVCYGSCIRPCLHFFSREKPSSKRMAMAPGELLFSKQSAASLWATSPRAMWCGHTKCFSWKPLWTAALMPAVLKHLRSR